MKKRNIVILILIIFLIFLYYTLKKDFFVYQDDLIFFNFFNSYNKSKKQTDKYKIEVSKGIQNYKINNLWTTIDKKTLLNEKVAPGTKGNFEIILVSNYKIKYKIDFKDLNQKPKNLEFYIKEGKEGDILKNETKIIHVLWEWKYEINSIKNIEDTKDGENLKLYNFEICLIGE